MCSETSDPVELEVLEMIEGIEYHTHVNGIDFYLPDYDLYIECKRFYTPRIAHQLSKVAQQKVVVVQGVDTLKSLICAVMESAVSQRESDETQQED